jgi:hypothetical protein
VCRQNDNLKKIKIHPCNNTWNLDLASVKWIFGVWLMLVQVCVEI